MTTLSKESVLDSISQMSVMDIVSLTKMMEEKFGVTASVPMAAAAAGPVASADAPPAEEKSEFSVLLTGFGEKKVAVIGAVRKITGGGLIETKKLVEEAQNKPVEIKAGVTKEDAEKYKKELEAAGASVELK